MKKLVLAAIAALTLGMGVASAQNLTNDGNAHWTASSPYNYSQAGG